MDALEVKLAATSVRPSGNQSLYGRLMAACLASIFLVWMLSPAWFLWEVTGQDAGYFDRDLVGLAESFSDAYRLEPVQAAREAMLARRIAQFSQAYAESALRDDEFAYRVTGHGRRVIDQSDSWGEVPVLDGPAGPVSSGGWRTVAVESADGASRVQIAVALSFLNRARIEMLIFFLVPLVAALPLLVLLLRQGISRALMPLDNLTRALIRHVPQSTGPLVCADARYAELRPVFESVNHLLARLTAYRENERRFIADAAHELRTPLAAIGAQVHLMVSAESAEERARLGDMLVASIDRSAALVGNLLTLSRLDAALSADVARQMVDVARLAREVVAYHAPRAIIKEMSLGYEGPDSACLLGSAAALESALNSVVDNALVYCPPGSSICIEVCQDETQVRIAVWDDGPGIAMELREEALRRFVRLPGSVAGGSGLGLSIVKRAAELHGGSVSLAEGPNGQGLKVCICLPAAAPSQDMRERDDPSAPTALVHPRPSAPSWDPVGLTSVPHDSASRDDRCGTAKATAVYGGAARRCMPGRVLRGVCVRAVSALRSARLSRR